MARGNKKTPTARGLSPVSSYFLRRFVGGWGVDIPFVPFEKLGDCPRVSCQAEDGNRLSIVFWYDEEESLRGDFDAIRLPEVEKVDRLKYCLLREQSTQKFLVFKSGPQPEDRDN